ncbi:MAG TPA: N-acetylneuraminate synthase [Bacillota bacterium]
MRIGSRMVGPGHPCYVIAEAGVNHNGDPGLAFRLVDAAAAAGADAVKFQTFKADRVASPRAAKAAYQRRTTPRDEAQLEMLRRLELPFDVFADLHAYCERLGIQFLSTPFDDESAEFLAGLGIPAFKVASGEVTNLPFLRRLAGYSRPLIISSGMAWLGEVEAAVNAVAGAGCSEVVLLHCVSNYPADPADVNLRAMDTLRAAFDVPVGYSDHTPGDEVALAAVARGACVLEKHFTLDRGLPGPDHAASLEPGELTALIAAVRRVEAALGDGRKRPAASEGETAAAARRSIVAACDIAEGTVLAETMLDFRRPGTGLPPALLEQVVGRTARRDIPAGAILSLDMVD